MAEQPTPISVLVISRDSARELLWKWDPIGVADVREQIPDEYDDAVDLLISCLSSGAALNSCRNRLAQFVRDNYGVEPEGLGELLGELQRFAGYQGS